MRKYFYLATAILTLFSISAFRPSGVLADQCGGPFPPKPANFWAKPGPNAGQVTLYWNEVPYANRYAIAYGTTSGNYQYGATNVGNQSSRSYTVSGLSGGKYYFVLAAARDCSSSPFSNEVIVWAGNGPTTIASEKTGSTWSKPIAMSNSLWAKSGPGIGQVSLSWLHKEDVDNYHLVYGTSKGNYQYGALNIGKVTSFTVSSLVPGKTYYFAFVPVKGDRALYTSDAVTGVALAPLQQQVVLTTPENLSQPEIVPQPSEEPEAFMFDESEQLAEDGTVNGIEDEATEDDYEYEDEESEYEDKIGGTEEAFDEFGNPIVNSTE